MRPRAALIALLVLASGLVSGCRAIPSSSYSHVAPLAAGPVPKVVAPRPTPNAPKPAPVRMVAWHGPVEGLFFHPLVLQPRLAFTRDRLGRGFQDYFVTAREFRGILDQLWRNGWTLVDAHRAASGHVRVPVGRRPLVLSEDDVNYYAYFAGRGLASRLVLDRAGDVRAEVRDASGVHLTTQDLVPLVDEAVARHPALSADGAKGVLALTGYEGLFGEHRLDDPAARSRVRALAARLRATGWTLASHTYGHIDLSRDSLADISRDTSRWEALARPLIGPTDVLVYPFGARPTVAGRRMLRDRGFRLQLDIDIRPRELLVDGVVLMSRRHVDGYAFDNPAMMARFFSVARVRDPARPR